ncbi:alpha/beta hydrolase [Proteus vulgaris]|uniref:alpha/beta hydrolase family protein n=1 Tax=Proteus vulgaris TaxID=585 RepID=UPI0021B14AC0|nr:alpha/beta hydrolase [Proteus vulgaris]MCT6517437.1 alpha/beta hydrolase [Proteus vulgaris]
MKKCFKSIWFYVALMALIFVFITSNSRVSDFELDAKKSTITPISFVSRADKLSGTLILPSNNDIKAVVILIHGDGAQDRFSNDGYLPLINRLLAAGIGVYTWDKAGVGESQGNWLFQSMQDRADEAQIALQIIQKKFTHTDIKIGYLGFSQAGWVIPIAATQSKPDFSVIIGGAVNWRDQGAYYYRVRLKANNIDSNEINRRVTEQLQQNDRVFGINGSHDTSAQGDMSDDRFYFVIQNYLSDSSKYLPNMNGRVLAMFGERDLNVDAPENACLYKTLLGNDADNTVALFPNTTHGLLKASLFNYQLENQWPWWKKILFIYLGQKSYTSDTLNILTLWITDNKSVPSEYSDFQCENTNSELR